MLSLTFFSGLVRPGVCDLEFQWVTAELFALRNMECHIPKEIDFTRYIKTNSNDSNSAKVLIEGKDVHINSVMESYLRNLSLNTDLLKIIEPLEGYNYMVQLNLERSNVSTGMCKPCLSFYILQQCTKQKAKADFIQIIHPTTMPPLPRGYWPSSCNHKRECGLSFTRHPTHGWPTLEGRWSILFCQLI
uniref:Uncharacterized protein n=1 Tax=Ditylenchus dipsaci TaxID=166011 RepID=A0A915DZP7_9BILA